MIDQSKYTKYDLHGDEFREEVELIMSGAEIDLFAGLTYTLYPDRDSTWEPERAYQLLVTALSLMPRCALQLAAYGFGVVTQVLDLSGQTEKLDLNSFKAPYPTLRVQADHVFTFPDTPYYSMVIPLKLVNGAEFPLLYVDEIDPANDPLDAVFQALGGVKDGEQIKLTLFVHRSHKPAFHRMAQTWNVFQRERQMNDPTRWYLRQPTTFEQVVDSKRSGEWFECYYALEVMAADKERVIQLAEQVLAQLNGFDRRFDGQPFNGFKADSKMASLTAIKNTDEAVGLSYLGLYNLSLEDGKYARQFEPTHIYLTPRELATVWHLPHRKFAATTVVWNPKHPEMSKAVAGNEEGILLGAAFYQGEPQAVWHHDDDRATHVNVVGRTGTGKSTFLHKLIDQDIADGKGVAVIDPHGDLVKHILRGSIPPEREGDVVVLDLAQGEYPLPLNLFAGSQSYGAIGRVVNTIESLYAQTGVRMDKYLRAGIQALQHIPQATMRDLYRFLTDTTFRGEVMTEIEDDLTFAVWQEEYHLLTGSQQRIIRDPILSRISPFYANPYLYPSLCHPDRIDLETLIREQKIVLVSLGVSGEVVPAKERNLIGALLVSLIQMVGMNPDRGRIPFYVYIDEVQNFITSSLETVFSEARKYGLVMTVANQFFGQLSRETLQGIMGNVGTTVIFRSNVDDARALAPYTSPQFNLEDLVNLDKYQAAIKLQHQGETQPAFLLLPFPPKEEPEDADEREQRIRKLSLKRYTPKSRGEVMAWLKAKYPSTRRTVIQPTTTDDDDFYE